MCSGGPGGRVGLGELFILQRREWPNGPACAPFCLPAVASAQAGETPVAFVLLPEGESGKEVNLRAGEKGALIVMGARLVAMAVATFYSGNGAVKFAKICEFG